MTGRADPPLPDPEARLRARITAADRRRAERAADRAAFAENRRHGLAARRRSKEKTMPVRVTHCPACRRERIARRVGTATVTGRKVVLVQCPEAACELVWAIRPEARPAAA